MYEHTYDKDAIIEAAIKSNVDALMYVKTDKGTENLKYVRLALDRDPRALFFVQFKTYAICEYAIKKNPAAIAHVPSALKNFKYLTKFCDNVAFQKMDDNMFPDLEYTDDEMYHFYQKGCWAAIKFYKGKNHILYADMFRTFPDVFYYMTRLNYLRTNEFLKSQNRLAVENALIEGIKRTGRGLLFQEVMKGGLTNLSDQFFMNVVKNDPTSLSSIPRERYSDDLLSAAVKNDPSVLRYIPRSYQTRRVVSEALQSDGLAIQFVKIDMTTKMVKQAVRNNAYALNYIDDPGFDLFDVALKHAPDTIEFLKLRTTKFLEYCDLHNISLPTITDVDLPITEQDVQKLVQESRVGRENDPNLLEDADINEIVDAIPDDIFE